MVFVRYFGEVRKTKIAFEIIWPFRLTKDIVKEWLYFDFLSHEFFYFLLTSLVQLSVSIFRKWVSASVHQFSHFVFSSCFKRRGNTNFLIFALSARIFLSLIETISIYSDNTVGMAKIYWKIYSCFVPWEILSNSESR